MMKRLLLISLIGICSLGIYAQRIMDLPAAPFSTGTDLMIVDQTDATRHITVTNLFAAVPVVVNATNSVTVALDLTVARNVIVDDTLFFADDSIYITDVGDELKFVVDDATTLSLTSTTAVVTGDATVSGSFAATGTISGNTGITLDTDPAIVLTAAMCKNMVRFNNDADVIDYTLPAAAAGLVVMFYDIAGGVITVDPVDGTNTIYLNGTSVGAGDAIDSPGAVGDFICLMALDDTRWVTVGRSGVWIDGGP